MVIMANEVDNIYNKYENYPLISYNCAKFMMDNNELIWKLLKYNDKDAYKNDSAHPNLTKTEKASLINNGDLDPDYSRFRIFFDFGMDKAVDAQISILRISPIELIPTNHIYGRISMGFEVYTHFSLCTLSNYQSRLQLISQQIIEIFNGQEIGFLGRIHFDAKASSRCRMTTAGVGEIPFKGNLIVMSNWIG
jgi:hypothetical protein